MENKGTDQVPIPKMPKPIERWGYETHFKEYLLLLASKGPAALETSSRYPEIIELGQTWHEILNQIRTATSKDGVERWAFVGVKEEKKGIFLPTTPIKGNKDYVPVEAIEKLTNLARNKSGVIEILGDIHSHPIDFYISLQHKLRSGSGDKRKIIDSLSWGDYYYLTVQPHHYFMGVTAGDINFFAFKARDSRGLGVSQEGFSQEQFEKYWTETTKNMDFQEEQIQIAKRHNLALYQGRRNENLVKVFPR